MVGFIAKEISNPLSLGQILKECRLKNKISLSQAAQATNISQKYLEAIEEGKYNELPGDVYARSFLRVYAKFLGQDEKKCLALYQTERKIFAKTKKTNANEIDFNKPVARISKVNLVVTPRIVRAIIIGVLALTCLLYLGIKIKGIITPPFLLIDQPFDNFVTSQNFVDVIGKVEPGATLEINGQQVLVDKQSKFKETIDLQSGINIIELRAQKRHSKPTKIDLKIVVNNGEEQ